MALPSRYLTAMDIEDATSEFLTWGLYPQVGARSSGMQAAPQQRLAAAQPRSACRPWRRGPTPFAL
jgi:hypothetical protein